MTESPFLPFVGPVQPSGSIRSSIQREAYKLQTPACHVEKRQLSFSSSVLEYFIDSFFLSPRGHLAVRH